MVYKKCSGFVGAFLCHSSKTEEICIGIWGLFTPVVELMSGAFQFLQKSWRAPKMVVPVNQVGFGTQKVRKRKGFCPVYQERWEQENAVVCMHLWSEVSKPLNNINKSTKVAGRSSRIILLPLCDPESFQWDSWYPASAKAKDSHQFM